MEPRKAKTRPLTKAQRNKQLALPFVTDVLVALLTDGLNSLPCYRIADYRMDVATVKRRVSNEGLYFVVKVLPDLIQTVFDRLEGRTASFHGLVTHDDCPVFLRSIISRAIAGESVYVRFLYQFCVCFKKTEDAFLGNASKEERRMWLEYQAVDDELRSVDWFSTYNEPILERARHYAKVFSQTFDPFGKEAIPRPGPGGTNTKRPHYERYVPFVKYSQLDRVYRYSSWFYSRPSILTDRARTYLGHCTLREQPCSRYKAVPKTATKLRGICLEENEVQYLQQGLRRALTKHISRHPLYRRRIILHDQTTNQWMAFESSKSRSFATIDMKDASDRISRELVAWLFQDNPDLLAALMALSTRYVMPPFKGEHYATAKFAPMGSAICFPVMSLVFMFLIRGAITTSDLPNPHLLSTNVFVYGDDIVIPSVAYDVVTKALQSFGLVVNLTKSYVKSSFRESCGVHAYDGMDVTPVYIRKFPKRSTLAPLRSMIETESQFFEKGYYCVAQKLRQCASRVWPKFMARPLYVTQNSALIGWKRTGFTHSMPLVVFKDSKRCSVMTDCDYQRQLVKGYVLTQKTSFCTLLNGADRLLRWYAVKPEEDGTDSTLQGDQQSQALRARACWEPREHVHNAVLPASRCFFSSAMSR